MRSQGASVTAAALSLLAAVASWAGADAPDPTVAPTETPAQGARAATGTPPASWSPDAPFTEPRPLVHFRGNVRFSDHVYRALLDLPPRATASEETAARVQRQLERFLRRAGYELATVRAAVDGDRILAAIDEGLLDSVVLLGIGGWDSLRFHLDFSLPDEVYNTPQIAEQLRLLCPRYGAVRCTATLSPVEVQSDGQPGAPPGAPSDAQPATRAFAELGGLGGTLALLPEELVRGGRSQRLLIRLERGQAAAGFSPTLDVGLPDGLTLGIDGLLSGPLAAAASTELKLRASVNTLGHLDGSGSLPAFTHGLAVARVRLPAPFGLGLKPAVALDFDLLTRQRGDLGVDRVMQARLDLAAAADFTGVHGLELALGLGLRNNWLFGLSTWGPVDPTVTSTPDQLLRPFLVLYTHVDLTPDQLRVDRHHELFVLARLRSGAAGAISGEGLDAELRYQRFHPIGYNELWLRLHGQARLGEVLYTDEQSLAGELRGNLSGLWFRDAATALGELRLSIVREVLKVSAWSAGGVAGKIVGRAPLQQSPVGYVAVGLGLHGLGWSLAATDAFVGVGFASDGSRSFAFTLELREAYR